jgi:hypothetical protein
MGIDVNRDGLQESARNQAVFRAGRTHHTEFAPDELAAADVRGTQELLGGRDLGRHARFRLYFT